MDLENKKIENIVRNAYNRPYLTKFLTISEQTELEKYKKDYNIYFSNTYPDEERKRAFLSLKDMSITPDFKISLLKINAKKKLAHPDILGAILSLGLNREVIGDILVQEQIVICIDEVCNFIISNLNYINKLNVQMEKIANFDFFGNTNYEEKEIIISSLRLDSVIAKGYNLSRGNAQELIENRLVMINGKLENRCDYICNTSDIVSIRRLGRLKILDVSRITKKDKLVLNILIIKR